MGAPIVIFDLDGTLIDSAPDIHAASARLLSNEGVTPLPFETVRSFIGHGVPALVDQIIEETRLDSADRERLIAAFLKDYSANSAVHTRIFPDVRSSLSRLRGLGYRLGVCTNKPVAPTHDILDALGLSDLFDAVVGGDSLPTQKPDPTGLCGLVNLLGNGPALFVGDSAVDAMTAVRSKVLFGLFTEGYLNARIETVRYTFRFEAYADLPMITEEIFAHQGVMV